MNARDDPTITLLAGLFGMKYAVDPQRLWELLECVYVAGRREGIDEAMSIVRGPKREQEAQEAQIRG